MKKVAVAFLLAGLASGAALVGAQGNRVTLTWWDYYTGSDGWEQALNAQFNAYKKTNPNVDFKRTPVPFGDLKSKIIQASATNTMPDLVLIDNPDHQAFASQGVFADITDRVKSTNWAKTYFNGPYSSTVFKGKNYGVPFVSNATAMFYNADLLREAGIRNPPLTWTSLRSAAKKLTSSDRYGFCFSAVGSEEGTFTFLPFLWSTGSDIPTIGDSGSLRAATLLADMVNKDKSVSKAIINWGQGDVYQQFAAQKCAMMINGPWQVPNFKNDKVNFNWGVAPWPRDRVGVSILGGENLALGAGKNVNEAFKFVNWLATPERLKPLQVVLGVLPNRTDMANDPTWKNDPIQRVFLQQVSVAKARAYGPKYPQLSEQVWTMFQSAITAKVSPGEAIKTAQAAIPPLLP
jgi:multiple sugar transport system substrate-binding protein